MSNKLPQRPQNASLDMDLSTDREQGLAAKFEDPSLDEIVPGIAGDPSYGASVVQEAADAVHALVTEVSEDNVSEGLEIQTGPDSEVFHIGGDEASFDISQVEVDTSMEIQKDLYVNPTNYQIEEEMPESVLLSVRWQMAQKFFQMVAAEISFSELVDGILQTIVGALDAQAGSILELDQEKREYFFRSIIGGGDPDRLKAFRVPANKGIVGHVAETKEVLVLKDLEDDDKQLRAISMSAGFETKTCLAAPIIIGNQLYGVVELFNKKDSSYFTQVDVRLLEDAVKMATKALEVRFLMAAIQGRTK